MATFTDPSNLSELLIRSGLISSEDLASCDALSTRMRLPLGSVITSNGFLTEEKFNGVVYIQTLMLDNKITQEQALKALELMARNNFTADTALGRVLVGTASAHLTGATTSKLGDLMCEAEIISRKQLEEGMRKGRESGLPLGRVLVATGVISRGVLNSALSAQKLIDEAKVPRDKAKLVLRSARLKSISFPHALAEHQMEDTMPEAEFGVVELLNESNRITDIQLSTARELAIIEERDVVEVIRDSGLVDAPTLEALPQLIEYVTQKQLMPEMAVQAVRRMRKEPVEEVMASLDYAFDEDTEGVELPEFLLESGLVSKEELDEATKEALNSRVPLARKLIESGLTDERTLSVLLECKSLVDQGIVHLEQAKIAVCYALENNVTVSDSLHRFGWLPYIYEGERDVAVGV